LCENIAVSEVCTVSNGHLLNPTIAQFLMKKKGDALSVLRVSHLSKRRRAYEMRISHPTKRSSSVVEVCLHFTYAKKEYLQIILLRILLAPTRSMTVGTHTHTYVCQWAQCGPSSRSTPWSTSCLISLKHSDCHGYKSW
jgi:hypothetical protein